MFVPCVVCLRIIDQHYTLTITPLFDTLAPTCFGIYVPSSGSFSCPNELLEGRIDYAVCLRQVAYINSHIHCILLDKQHNQFCLQVTHKGGSVAQSV
jgi:hypothetical protein